MLMLLSWVCYKVCRLSRFLFPKVIKLQCSKTSLLYQRKVSCFQSYGSNSMATAISPCNPTGNIKSCVLERCGTSVHDTLKLGLVFTLTLKYVSSTLNLTSDFSQEQGCGPLWTLQLLGFVFCWKAVFTVWFPEFSLKTLQPRTTPKNSQDPE